MNIDESAVIGEVLAHIKKQRVRAKLIDQPFELGILTDKKQSQIIKLLRTDKSVALLKEIGMTEYGWNDDALRSELKLAGENLFISICRSR